MQSRTLDHVGVFARDVADAAMLADVLAGYDAGDPDTRPAAAPRLLAAVAADAARPPNFAFVRTPVWSDAEPATPGAFERLVETLGDRAVEVACPTASPGA